MQKILENIIYDFDIHKITKKKREILEQIQNKYVREFWNKLN